MTFINKPSKNKQRYDVTPNDKLPTNSSFFRPTNDTIPDRKYSKISCTIQKERFSTTNSEGNCIEKIYVHHLTVETIIGDKRTALSNYVVSNDISQHATQLERIKYLEVYMFRRIICMTHYVFIVN